MLSHTARKDTGYNPSVFDGVEEGKQKKGWFVCKYFPEGSKAVLNLKKNI